MPVYFGEMQLPGQPEVLPATVTIEKGVIRLNSGRTELGEWKLYEVGIQPADDQSCRFKADGEELILRLNEHDSFVAETAPYRRGEKRVRRAGTHEAFRKPEDDGPTLAEDIKKDVAEVRQEVGAEISVVMAEAQSLWTTVKANPLAWAGLAVVLILSIFLSGLIASILLIGGLLALVVGALALAEESIERRLPPVLNPARLIVVGTVALVLGILIGLLF